MPTYQALINGYPGEIWNIRHGEDASKVVLLLDDGFPYIATGATIKAQLQSGGTGIGSAQTLADSGNSNYAAGMVDVIFPDTETTGAEWTAGFYDLEIFVTESGGDKILFQAKHPVKVVASAQG